MPNIGEPLEKNGKIGNCHYCCRQMLPRESGYKLKTLPPLHPTREHVHPKAHGGMDWVWACYQCNAMKGNQTERQWGEFMRQHPRWWVTPPRPTPAGNPATNRIPKPKRTASETMRFLMESGQRAQVAADMNLHWPWLRDLVASRVRDVGWGPWK